MTPQQLKDSILQMAIEGKLVPQIESEGNAEDLYKQIQKEKQQLIKEGKVKKEKPLDPISEDEIPFEIPKSWKWVRWGDISHTIQYGFNAPAETIGTIRMVRISDIENSKVKWDSVPFCKINEQEFSAYQLKENDILFARTGGTVGKSFLVSKVPYKAVFAGYLIRTQYGEMLSPQFLKMFMDSRLYWSQLHNGTIATAQPNCNGNTLGKMVLPLPPLAEQERIVAKLEKLLPMVDKYGEAYNQLTELENQFPADLKKSILQYAMEGKLVPQIESEGNAEELYKQIQIEKEQLIKEGKIKKEKPLNPIKDDEIPFDIPQSWKWVRFGEVFYHNTGKALNSSNHQGELKDYITTSNLYWNRFDLSKLKKMPFTEEELKKCTVRKGDLLICEGGDFGRTALWNYDYEICIQNHIHRARPYYTDTCLMFYYYVLYLWKGTNQIAGKGIGIQGLSTNALHNLIIPLPPLAEQKRIVDKIEELFRMIDIRTSE